MFDHLMNSETNKEKKFLFHTVPSCCYLTGSYTFLVYHKMAESFVYLKKVGKNISAFCMCGKRKGINAFSCAIGIPMF